MSKIHNSEQRRGFIRRPVVLGLLIAGVAYVAFIAFMKLFLPTYRVPTASMTPTIHMGDHVVVSRYAYRWPTGGRKSSPRRWDILVYRTENDLFLQRVAATPGETIEIKSKQLFINGRPIVDPFASHTDVKVHPKLAMLPEPYRSRDWFGPLRLEPGQYFVLGDNRDASHDSRYRGAIEEAYVVGKVIYIRHAE